MIAKVRSMAKLLSPLYDFSATRFDRFNELTIDVNAMNSSVVFCKLKFQSAIVVEVQESDRNPNNRGDGFLILFE